MVGTVKNGNEAISLSETMLNKQVNLSGEKKLNQTQWFNYLSLIDNVVLACELELLGDMWARFFASQELLF